jgi:hypothetical protein
LLTWRLVSGEAPVACEMAVPGRQLLAKNEPWLIRRNGCEITAGRHGRTACPPSVISRSCLERLRAHGRCTPRCLESRQGGVPHPPARPDLWRGNRAGHALHAEDAVLGSATSPLLNLGVVMLVAVLHGWTGVALRHSTSFAARYGARVVLGSARPESALPSLQSDYHRPAMIMTFCAVRATR